MSARRSARAGDVVQVQGWIGVVEDTPDALLTVRWSRSGGPFGSARTTGIPQAQAFIRTDLVATGDDRVWDFAPSAEEGEA